MSIQSSGQGRFSGPDSIKWIASRLWQQKKALVVYPTSAAALDLIFVDGSFSAPRTTHTPSL